MYCYYLDKVFVLQWNPVNKTTFGPRKFGRINGVAVLTGFSNKRLCGVLICSGHKKGVVVLQGGRMVGFHLLLAEIVHGEKEHPDWLPEQSVFNLLYGPLI